MKRTCRGRRRRYWPWAAGAGDQTRRIRCDDFFSRGAFGIGRHPFRAPTLPLDEVKDPTGAGDSFAGGFMGYVASQPELNREVLKRALFYGGVMGSFAVETFGTERLQSLTREESTPASDFPRTHSSRMNPQSSPPKAHSDIGVVRLVWLTIFISVFSFSSTTGRGMCCSTAMPWRTSTLHAASLILKLRAAAVRNRLAPAAALLTCLLLFSNKMWQSGSAAQFRRWRRMCSLCWEYSAWCGVG